ncbi:MAG: hypothetical protein ACT4PE_05665 [Candidatus Eiseniibacteriota bacterium]
MSDRASQRERAAAVAADRDLKKQADAYWGADEPEECEHGCGRPVYRKGLCRECYEAGLEDR